MNRLCVLIFTHFKSFWDGILVWRQCILKNKCNSYLDTSILGHHIPKLVDATQSSRLTVFRLRHFAASHADLEKEEGEADSAIAFRSWHACMLEISGIECLPSLFLCMFQISHVSRKFYLYSSSPFFVVSGKEPSRWFLVQVVCWWNFDWPRDGICKHCLRLLNQIW